MNLLEPYIAFRRVLLQVLSCTDCSVQHLLESASTLRKVLYLQLPIMSFSYCLLYNVLVMFSKGARLSQAAAALHEFKSLCAGNGITQNNLYLIGRVVAYPFANNIFLRCILSYIYIHVLLFPALLPIGPSTKYITFDLYVLQCEFNLSRQPCIIGMCSEMFLNELFYVLFKAHPFS